jgi:hypothetical protein
MLGQYRPYFFCFHLVDIVFRFRLLQYVLSSLMIPWKQLVATVRPVLAVGSF